MQNAIQVGMETARHADGLPVIGAIKRYLHRWSEVHRVERELSMLSRRELADMGLTPYDIHDVARGNFRKPD